MKLFQGRKGNGFLFAAVVRALSVGLCCVGLCSCNFFGKRDDTATQMPPDEISNGQSIIGEWSFSNGSATSTDNPADALTTMYSFQPNSVVNVQIQDPHQNGILCTGYGQYRIWGNDVQVFIQGSSGNSTSCTIPAFTDLGTASVQTASILFTPNGGATSYYWAVRNAAPVGPVGLWNFNGQGGIDWLYFDPYGYFLLQSTVDAQASVLQGFYIIQQETLALVFFINQDPAQYQSELDFSQFVTDGTTLTLIQTSGSGSSATTSSVQGTRL